MSLDCHLRSSSDCCLNVTNWQSQLSSSGEIPVEKALRGCQASLGAGRQVKLRVALVWCRVHCVGRLVRRSSGQSFFAAVYQSMMPYIILNSANFGAHVFLQAKFTYQGCASHNEVNEFIKS